MKILVVIVAVLVLVVSLPIGLYLQYQILVRVNATELMWFLFWVNVPVFILGSIVTKIAEKLK